MKLKRELRFDDVMRMCVQYDLYTNGCNDEYEELMNFINETEDMTDYKLMLVAKDILKYSITDYSLDTIITLLNKRIFIQVEE